MMMDYRTLSRIASAQYDAQKMRLPGTADRLDILRKELEGYHEVPVEKAETKRRWALAKLEDTERTFRREVSAIGDEDRERIGMMRVYAKGIRTVLYLAVTLSVADLLKRSNTYMDIGVVMAGGALVAATMGALVERLFGGTLEGAARNIQKAIRECRASLSGNNTFI